MILVIKKSIDFSRCPSKHIQTELLPIDFEFGIKDISVMSLSSSPNMPRSDLKRDRPRPALPMAMNGLPKRMENTQAWNESVTTNSASMKPLSHCSTGGCMRSASGAQMSSTRELTRNGTRPRSRAILSASAAFAGVSSRM